MKKTRKVMMLIALFLLTLIMGCKKDEKVIKLNDYVFIEMYGYDTKGEANVRVDTDEIHKKIIKDMKFDSVKDEEYFYEDVEDAIDAELDKYNDLSNGDTVVLHWDLDNKLIKEIEKRSNCKFVYDEEEIKVESLEPLVEYNVFDEMEVSFVGINGEGELRVKMPEDMPNNIYLTYICDNDTNLNNGDRIIIKLYEHSDYFSNNQVKEYGIDKGVNIIEVEREYVVEGLYDYITSVNQVNNEAKAELEANSKQMLENYVASRWTKPGDYQGATLVGEALVRVETLFYDKMAYALIHKVDVNDGSEEFTYYYYTMYYDVLVSEDGQNSYNLNSCKASSDMYPQFERNGVTYHGALTVEQLFEEIKKGCVNFECLDIKIY